MPPSPPRGEPRRASALRRLAPYFLLGPVSGPLTAGVVNNLRGGRPFLASMYGFLLASWLVVESLELTHIGPILHRL